MTRLLTLLARFWGWATHRAIAVEETRKARVFYYDETLGREVEVPEGTAVNLGTTNYAGTAPTQKQKDAKAADAARENRT